jgi:N-acyl-D-amino-acid deacylase
MFDTVIINGKIIDGTGNPWIATDVGIVKGKITKVGPMDSAEARQTIDARGRFVCPGFVDGHSHSDLFILAEPEARQKVMQGITTENLGMDGMSVAPILEKDIPGWRRHLAGLAGDPEVEWRCRGCPQGRHQYLLLRGFGHHSPDGDGDGWKGRGSR